MSFVRVNCSLSPLVERAAPLAPSLYPPPGCHCNESHTHMHRKKQHVWLSIYLILLSRSGLSIEMKKMKKFTLTISALHLGLLPLPVCFTANHWKVALFEAWVALVADDGADRIFVSGAAEGVGVLHLGRGATGHCGHRWEDVTLRIMFYLKPGSRLRRFSYMQFTIRIHMFEQFSTRYVLWINLIAPYEGLLKAAEIITKPLLRSLWSFVLVLPHTPLKPSVSAETGVRSGNTPGPFLQVKGRW